jgi:hypothetical protein
MDKGHSIFLMGYLNGRASTGEVGEWMMLGISFREEPNKIFYQWELRHTCQFPKF